MNDNGISLSDIAALLKSDHDDHDGYGILILLFLFMGLGFGGFGMNRQPAPQQQGTGAIDTIVTMLGAQGGPVTNSGMNDAMRLQSIQQGQRDIVDAVNSNKYDIVNANKDTESRIIANQSTILANQQANARDHQACCQDVKYNSAMNTASINQNITSSKQEILDRVNEIENQRLRDESAKKDARIQALEQQMATNQQFQQVGQRLNNLDQQMFMTTKYPNPNAFSYTAGMNPFCGSCCNGQAA